MAFVVILSKLNWIKNLIDKKHSKKYKQIKQNKCYD